MSELYDSVEKLADMFREANERAGNLAGELSAMTRENDFLRREVEALVGVLEESDCPPYQECARDNGGNVQCRECWTAWAKQQAAQAGKDGNNECG